MLITNSSINLTDYSFSINYPTDTMRPFPLTRCVMHWLYTLSGFAVGGIVGLTGVGGGSLMTPLRVQFRRSPNHGGRHQAALRRNHQGSRHHRSCQRKLCGLAHHWPARLWQHPGIAPHYLGAVLPAHAESGDHAHHCCVAQHRTRVDGLRHYFSPETATLWTQPYR